MKSYDIRFELQQRFQKMGSDGIVLNSCIAREWREGGGGGGREEIFKEAWIDCTVSSKWKTINGTAGRSKNSLGGENCASLPTAVIIISISVPERLANENYKTDCLDFFLFPFLSFFPLPFLFFLKSKVYEKFLENSTTSLTINWNSVEKLFQRLKNKYP